MHRIRYLLGLGLAALALSALSLPALAAPQDLSAALALQSLAPGFSLVALCVVGAATVAYRRGGETTSRLLMLGLVVVGVAALQALPALAQTTSVVAAPAPPPGTTTTIVTLPYGEWIAGAQSILVTVLTLVITAVIAWLPRPLGWVIGLYGADRIAKDAVNLAIAATPGASRDAKLEVDVGSAVLARAINYFKDQASSSVIKSLGGEKGIADKLIGLIPLAPHTTADQVKAEVGLPPTVPSARL